MRYGRAVEEGFLPVYSVDTAREARELLTFVCPTVRSGPNKGEFFAPELAEEQTIDRLLAFGRKLQQAHKALLERNPGWPGA